MNIRLLVSVLIVLAGGSAWSKEELTEGQRLLTAGDRVFAARDYKQATALFEQAVEAARREQDDATLVEALSMAARGYLIRDEREKGRPWLERAGKHATEAEPNGWSRYLGVRGRFEWKDGDKPRAANTFKAMYAYCLEHELYARAVDAAHMVAIVGTSDEQVEWAQKGIAAAEKGAMDGWLGPLWNNLGVTFHELGRDQDALEAYRKARHYHWKVGGEHQKLVADWAVGMAYRKVGDFEKAKAWLRPVLAWAQRRLLEEDGPERREWVALTKAQLGLVALAEGRYAQAAKLLAPACETLKAVGMPDWDAGGWKEYTDALAQASAGK